jgi:hypothetical protein
VIYIAGPMRGYPKFNFPAFRNAAADLRQLGYDVLSPHELDEEIGLTEDTPTDKVTKQTVFQCLRRDMEAISRCDAIALLPGWEKSSGANLELAVAERIGCKVYIYDAGATQPLTERRAAAIGYHMEIRVL